jgi:uncharacterized protein (DUF58 family)
MLLPTYSDLVAIKNHTSRRGLGGARKALAQTFGSHQSKHKGRGLDFAEFREYTQGDEIRNIDWRVTARTGKPHSKLFMEERERNVYVLLDMNDYMNFGTRGTFKSVQAAHVAAFIGWSAIQSQDKFGAIVFGQVPGKVQVLKAKRTKSSLSSLLNVVSSPPSEGGFMTLGEVLRRSRQVFEGGSRVYIISDFVEISDDFETQLSWLNRKCEVSLIRISDPADTAIKVVESLDFTDGRGQTMTIESSQKRELRDYLEQSKLNQESLRKLAHRNKIGLIEIATDQDVVRSLKR